MYTYKIEGLVNHNDADNDEGYATVGVIETVEVDEMSVEAAKEKFFAENEQYDDFFDAMKNCDQETHGKKGATYKDSQGRVIEVELLKKCNCH